MTTDHVIGLVSRIREKANALILVELERRGHPELSPSHGAILKWLYEEGPLPMGVLAKKIGRQKNTVTTLIRKLERTGYVERNTDSHDNRVQRICLTEKGQAFRSDFDAISELLLTAVWGDMEQAQKEHLVAGLERILHNLK
ncbi:MarR family winged helix-turn-helix transcriptional regulator [Desulfovibrio inopinatus]|uniref:MarR family winged helix-turn-helix transcriptional regulator n=1 Tax=Desulfovibrio inopinatus TaxID=102109 RepID=UPI0004082DAA|nr:MarR family transcriptional regulator [Desulfovibrio inopinatus]